MIYRGEDKIINVTIQSTYVNASGRKVTTPVDLTAFNGYIIYVYSEETGVLIDKFSENTAAGYVLIDVVDAINGKVALFLDKTKTTSAPIGKVYGELKTSIVNADFSVGNYYTVAKFPIDTVSDSLTNTVVPPL
jgi:hypothetical protein